MAISPENKTPVDITADKNGGLLKEVIREGTGDETPLAGDTVIVHYTGNKYSKIKKKNNYKS